MHAWEQVLPAAARSSESAQEIEQGLCLPLRELIEVVDDLIRFRALAFVFLDRAEEVSGAAVVQEKDALAKSPERRGAKFAAAGGALTHAIREIRSHVVQKEIGKGFYGHVALTGWSEGAACL